MLTKHEAEACMVAVDLSPFASCQDRNLGLFANDGLSRNSPGLLQRAALMPEHALERVYFR